MCKLAEKPVLVIGGGISQLAYYCATEGVVSRRIKVINGFEKGGPLKNITKVLDGNPKKLKALEKDVHVYLDNLSGDFYSYENKQWIPRGNFGLHDQRAEASLQGEIKGGAADILKRIKIHEDRDDKQKPALIFNNTSDEKVVIRREFVKHWLLKDLPHEFVIENKNAWDSHSINITDKGIKSIQNCYTILASNSKGPNICEHFNSICLNFQVL
jgi:hypothetical protein